LAKTVQFFVSLMFSVIVQMKRLWFNRGMELVGFGGGGSWRKLLPIEGKLGIQFKVRQILMGIEKLCVCSRRPVRGVPNTSWTPGQAT
jgi:hypothetical protein